MFENKLKSFLAKMQELINRFTSGKGWEFKLALIAFSIVLFFSFPDLPRLGTTSTWEVVQKQIENPFVQYNLDDPESHQAKRTFRLSMPMLFKAFHADSPYVMYAFQLLVALALFYITAKFVTRITGDKTTAVSTVLALSFTYIGQSGIVDIFAKFDGIAITCLLAAMYFRNPFIIFILCFAAAWTDERGLIALALVFFWWKSQEVEFDKFNLGRFILPLKNSLAVILAGVAYLGLRYFMIHKFHFVQVTQGVGLDILKNQFNMLLFGVWTGFEGLWIIVIIALAALLTQRRYFYAIALTAVLIPSVMASMLVMDLTRSMIYCFPLLFISFFIISKTENSVFIRNAMLIGLLICILVPTYFAEGAFRIEGNNPVIFKIIKGVIVR